MSGGASEASAVGAGGATGVGSDDHDVRAVLAIRPFRALWLCLGLSSFGDWLGLLATTSMAASFGARSSFAAANLAVSAVLLLRLAPAVLFGALAGAVADRWDRKATMVVGDLLRAALFISIPLVGTLWWLFVATLAIEVVALFWGPAKDASVPNLVPARRLGAANQVSLAVTYGSAPVAALAFSGMALVSRLLPAGGHALGGRVALALYADAATYLIAAAVIARLRIPRPVGWSGGSTAGPAQRPPSLARSILDGWRFVAGTPLVRGLVVGMVGAFAAGGFVIGVAPTFVTELGGGDAGYGVLFGCVFTGLALGMWTGPRTLVALARWRLFALSLVLAGVLLVAAALVGHLELVAVLSVALGACGGIAWVTGYTLLGAEVADELRGRTFAFVASAARIVLIGVIALAPALAAAFGEHRYVVHGVVVHAHGASLTLLVGGVLAALIGALAHRQLDDGSGDRLRAELARAWRLRRSARPEPPRRETPGFFIAVEGGDGSGKSTQVAALADWLASVGHDVVVTREPGATAVGAQLRELLLHGPEGESLAPRAEAMLYAADRAQHVAQVVRPALARGSLVLTDRYIDSSVAYQGAGRALDADEVAGLSRWATHDLLPDLTVVLDVSPAVAASRLGDQLDRLEREPAQFHAAVRARFLDLARRSPRRYLVVDADLPAAEVTRGLREGLAGRLPLSPREAAQAATDRARVERARAEQVAARIARADRMRRERTEARVAERERREAARRAEATARADRREKAQAEAEARAAERQRREAERRAAAVSGSTASSGSGGSSGSGRSTGSVATASAAGSGQPTERLSVAPTPDATIPAGEPGQRTQVIPSSGVERPRLLDEVFSLGDPPSRVAPDDDAW